MGLELQLEVLEPANGLRKTSCHVERRLKMKVCQVPSGIGPVPPCGADSSAWETYRLAKALVQGGISVDVYSVRGGKEAGYRLIEIPLPSTERSSTFGQFAGQIVFGLSLALDIGLLNARKYDLVHYHCNATALPSAMLLRHGGCPYVVTVGDPFFGATADPVTVHNLVSLERSPSLKMHRVGVAKAQQVLLSGASGVVTYSKTIAKRLAALYRLDSRKIETIPPGVDTTVFKPRPKPGFLLARHGIEESTFVVLVPARIVRLKQQLALMPILKKLEEQHRAVQFVFMGPIGDSTYHRTILDYAGSHCLVSRLTFTGSVSAAVYPYYYNLADVVILPSMAEGFASSILEGMSSGKPVIASDIPPNREAIRRGGEVIPVNINDERRVTEELTGFIEDKRRRQKSGEEARASALEFYDWSVIARSMSNYYQGILK